MYAREVLVLLAAAAGLVPVIVALVVWLGPAPSANGRIQGVSNRPT